VTVKEVNHIRRFAIDIAMEHLCVLQLETALATLVIYIKFVKKDVLARESTLCVAGTLIG
jgi:hypothetical protein